MKDKYVEQDFPRYFVFGERKDDQRRPHDQHPAI